MDRDTLIKEYAAIIDQQKEEIASLKNTISYLRADLLNPPPDVQEKVLLDLEIHDKLKNLEEIIGRQGKMILNLEDELDELNTIALKDKETADALKKELEEYRSIAEKMGAAKAVSEKEQWEKCADKLFSFAEIVKAIEGNSTRNPEYYNRACGVIEEYNRLKGNEQRN
jgi:chromosome segregation ATPase